MWEDFYRRVTAANRDKREPPLPAGSPFYALVEAMGDDAEDDARSFEQGLATLLDEGIASDAVIAQSDRERQSIWAVREDLRSAFTSLRPVDIFDGSSGAWRYAELRRRCPRST